MIFYLILVIFYVRSSSVYPLFCISFIMVSFYYYFLMNIKKIEPIIKGIICKINYILNILRNVWLSTLKIYTCGGSYDIFWMYTNKFCWFNDKIEFSLFSGFDISEIPKPVAYFIGKTWEKGV